MQIVDQFYGCPYRAPFRQPSLIIAMVLLFTVGISYMYSLIETNSSFLFTTLLTSGLISGLSDAISGQFHEYAMSNYNSTKNI